MAWDWLITFIMKSLLKSHSTVCADGKFLSRDGGTLILKAMRLPAIGCALNLSEKLSLRKRLDELSAADVNTLILTAVQAESVLGIAGQAGLCAMVEVAIDAAQLKAAGDVHDAIARATQTVSELRGYPALIGFLIDCTGERGKIPSSARATLRRELAALARAIHGRHGHELVAFERHMSDRAPAFDCDELDSQHSRDLSEDLTYVKLGRIDLSPSLGWVMTGLHCLAGARPLVIEFGEEFPGQVEMVWWLRRCGQQHRRDGRTYGC
jgi:hypothetical protein